MGLLDTSDDVEESPRRYNVDLKHVQPHILETDRAHEFIERLRQEEDTRLADHPPFGTQYEFGQERDRWDILRLPEPENKIKTAHSLGEQGTTVFVSEYGELVSFSKVLGLGTGGNVVVEPPISMYPLSNRNKELEDILDGWLPGIGLRLKHRKGIDELAIEYVHDRWPRVSYNLEAGGLEFEVQFAIHRGTIAQQYLVKNSTQDPKACDFKLDFSFGVRVATEDHRAWHYQLPLRNRVIFSTAGGYAARLWAGDERGQVQVTITLFQDGKSVKLDLSNQVSRPFEIAGDGDMDQQQELNSSDATISSPYYLHADTIEPGHTHELTAIYSLEEYRLTNEQEQALHRRPSFKADEDSPRKEQPVAESDVSKVRSISSRNGSDRKVSIQGSVNGCPTEPSNVVDNTLNAAESNPEEAFWAYEGYELSDFSSADFNPEEQVKLIGDLPNQQYFSPGDQYVDVSMLLKDNYHGNWTLKPTTTNALLRRHLQQLLFVNSVPVPNNDGQKGSESAIVMTEAHISDDSIPFWAGICMFRFLLWMYSVLNRTDVAQACLRTYLKDQIKYSCERHLEWVFDVSKPLSGGWASNYTLLGTYRKGDDSAWYYGAIQFIKLYEFRIAFQTLDDELFVLRKLRKRVGPWLDSLKRSQDPKSGMWAGRLIDVNTVWLDAQYRQDETIYLPEYLASDHMLLWEALSMVFFIVDDAILKASSLAKTGKSESLNAETIDVVNAIKISLPKNWRKTFSPSKLRTSILDQLVCEYLPEPRELGALTKDAVMHEREANKDAIDNVMRDKKEPSLTRRKRVLAFRWAGNDKPRYLWYSWASIIFDSVEFGFFNDESSVRLWKDTLEAQQVHRELSWEQLGRYIVAFRAAKLGQSLDTTMNAQEMVGKVRDRLLKSYYSNGTFPTRLDRISKRPVGKWWESDRSIPTFEAPLLLLQEESLVSSDNTSSLTVPVPRQGFRIRNTLRTQGDTLIEDDLDFDSELVEKQRAKLAKSARHSIRSNKIDRGNVQDPPDFEPDWLFPYPDCFSPDDPTGIRGELVTDRNLTKEVLDHLIQSFENVFEPVYKALKPGIEKLLSTKTDLDNYTFSDKHLTMPVIIVDVGQRSRSGTPGPLMDFYYNINKDLESHLSSNRTTKDAKKRLTIVHSCEAEQAVLLYLGSPDSEKMSTAGFLTRHKQREDFLKDHVIREANLWVTELHLSFYKITTLGGIHSSSREGMIFEDPLSLSTFPGEPNSSRKGLQKGAISWRFSGDLLDRRWTGTILAFIPGLEDVYWTNVKDFEFDTKFQGRKFHGQRKIIEAQLFKEMTKTIYVHTIQILKDLESLLEEGEGGIYRGNSGYYDPFSESFEQNYSRSKLYLNLSDFLSHLDDSLKISMGTIDEFIDREKQRQVQPRWSAEDEIQYRAEIRKWDREGRKNVALLDSLRGQISTKVNRIKHLGESLNADMQLREARLQARSAEDVRLFTYVTIVFLPISFSASLFSMQKAPGDSVVSVFAKVAVIALVITLVVLFNLKTMSRNIWTYINEGLHRISHLMSFSTWTFWIETREHLLQAEKRNIQSDEPLQTRRTSKWWFGLFLVAYCLLELPELRVKKAFHAVRPLDKDKPRESIFIRKAFHVILGLLFLPQFILVYPVLILLRKPKGFTQKTGKGINSEVEWNVNAGQEKDDHSGVKERDAATSTATRTHRLLRRLGWKATSKEKAQSSSKESV